MRTYVVRVADVKDEAAARDRLRGVVSDVITGRQTTFTDGAQLLENLLAGPVTDTPTEPESP